MRRIAPKRSLLCVLRVSVMTSLPGIEDSPQSAGPGGTRGPMNKVTVHGRSVEEAVLCSARTHACRVEAHLDAKASTRVSRRHAWARALRRADERVLIAIGGPQGQEDSFTVAGRTWTSG
jgi:hypothetical protein